jgi:hypothetical protein
MIPPHFRRDNCSAHWRPRAPPLTIHVTSLKFSATTTVYWKKWSPNTGDFHSKAQPANTLRRPTHRTHRTHRRCVWGTHAEGSESRPKFHPCQPRAFSRELWDSLTNTKTPKYTNSLTWFWNLPGLGGISHGHWQSACAMCAVEWRLAAIRGAPLIPAKPGASSSRRSVPIGSYLNTTQYVEKQKCMPSKPGLLGMIEYRME